MKNNKLLENIVEVKTVGELKLLLKDIPDDREIIFLEYRYNGGGDEEFSDTLCVRVEEDIYFAPESDWVILK